MIWDPVSMDGLPRLRDNSACIAPSHTASGYLLVDFLSDPCLEIEHIGVEERDTYLRTQIRDNVELFSKLLHCSLDLVCTTVRSI